MGGATKRFGDAAGRHDCGTASGWEVAWSALDFAGNLISTATGVGGIRNVGKRGAIHVVEGGSRGGVGPVNKGKAGVDKLIAAKEMEGMRVRAREVTLRTRTGRTRVDVVMDSLDGIRYFENKSGKGRLSSNQRKQFEALANEGGQGVGKNAKRAGVHGKQGPIRVEVSYFD